MIITEHSDHLELAFDNKVQEFGVRMQFSVAHPNAWHIRKRGAVNDDWDGLIHFCKPIKKGSKIFTLPVGFKAQLLLFLKTENLDFDFSSIYGEEVEIPYAQHLTNSKNGFSPLIFDEIQEAACRALLSGRRRVIELGTASGKTEIFINAYACLREVYPDLRAAVIVPKKNLLTQTAERIYERLQGTTKVGIVGMGKFETDAGITVATAQTACGHDKLTKSADIQEWLGTLDLLILDECHRAAISEQWQSIIKKASPKWLWAVSAKVTYYKAKNKLKEMSLEGLFGPPAYQGFSKERTCPVTVVFHYHTAWKGKFDDKELYGTFTDMMPCTFRREPNLPWEEGVWRGPDIAGICPSWMMFPRESDIASFDPITNQPIWAKKALIRDPEDLTKWIYNPDRKVPNKDFYGVYQPTDKEKSTKEGWTKIEVPSKDVVYFTRHDVAIMEFSDRNKWAIALAQEFTKRGQAWVISVCRTRHANKIMAALRKVGIKANQLDGKMRGDDQRRAIEQVREGEIPGLVAPYSIISEGTDIPRLIHLIKLDGISEEQVLEQQKGRVQRIFGGKSMGYIHIPRDLQEKNLNKACGEMVSYYRHRKIPIKKLTL